jgi:hypothetical protein
VNRGTGGKHPRIIRRFNDELYTLAHTITEQLNGRLVGPKIVLRADRFLIHTNVTAGVTSSDCYVYNRVV